MATSPELTVTADRVSNSGNLLAEQERAGKAIHLPAGEIGETYEVKLIDKGGHYVAKLVDRVQETQPRQPSVTSSESATIDIDSFGHGSRDSHSFEIDRSPVNRANRSSSDLLRRMSRRKK